MTMNRLSYDSSFVHVYIGKIDRENIETCYLSEVQEYL